ncbi:MAG: hypothetical protein E4G94_01225 [ANME-2 cluster archaeon]|nr:MAG: hypothetical protein E4G94_01225 [ANME-2 cluster archaeon]
MTPSEPLSPIVLSTLREIMGHPYHLSRDAIIYSEVVTGELNYKGMGEMRDVLEHLQRTINTNNEDEALDDLTEAFEHMRRAAVESVQRAATKEYFETLQAIRIPSLAFRVAFLDVPEKGKVRELRMNAMKKIANGRSNKADKNKWENSIEDFKSAIENCFELKDMFPSNVEVKYRILNILFGTVTIIALIYAYLK